MKVPPIFSLLKGEGRIFASALLWLLGGACLHAAEAPKDAGQPAGQASEQAASKAVGTPVIVVQAAPACFSVAVRVTGFLAPREEAIVSHIPEGFDVAEILAGEGDIVSEAQPLARLARGGAEAGGGKGAGQGAAGGLPASIVLRAPAAGTIVKSTARIGVAASPRGEPLFLIAIDGLIEADAEVSSIDLSAIKEDQTARIEIERGRETSGRVRKVAAEIDPVTQMGHVRVAIARDPSLRAGRFIRAAIDARQSCGISVPRSAVLYKTDGTSVQVVRGHIIETLRVRVGLLSDHNAEIQEGVRTGDLIVAHAGTSLRDGDRVSPVFAEEAVPSTRRSR
jgi:multidrug efflux pump subunit AcrA (membrane-fusion protein)